MITLRGQHARSSWQSGAGCTWAVLHPLMWGRGMSQEPGQEQAPGLPPPLLERSDLPERHVRYPSVHQITPALCPHVCCSKFGTTKQRTS
jgi:hypothetical protein